MKWKHGWTLLPGAAMGLRQKVLLLIMETLPYSRGYPAVTVLQLLIRPSERRRRALIHQDVTTWEAAGRLRATCPETPSELER